MSAKCLCFIVLAALAALAGLPAAGAGASELDRQRLELLEEIRAEAKLTGRETGRAGFSNAVMTALATVPRHRFVPADQIAHAYENRPLGIGHGQTISQPYIVALMTDLLDLTPQSRVLEVGTGSGYQAAVLAELTARVYSIEIIEPLGLEARARLARLGYHKVTTSIGDGYYGWEEHAPFDAIMVTAAADHVPPPLVRQLKPGGRMVIPVGSRFLTQSLILVEKDRLGEVKTRQLLPVRFVPLTGKH